jgi:hypothetical protein
VPYGLSSIRATSRPDGRGDAAVLVGDGGDPDIVLQQGVRGRPAEVAEALEAARQRPAEPGAPGRGDRRLGEGVAGPPLGERQHADGLVQRTQAREEAVVGQALGHLHRVLDGQHALQRRQAFQFTPPGAHVTTHAEPAVQVRPEEGEEAADRRLLAR